VSRPKLQRWLIWPDTHMPYHDEEAVEALMRDAAKWKPDGLVVLGDWWDFYRISTFDKDPERRLRFDEEVAIGKRWLDRVAKLAPARIFTEGNHEVRLGRYLSRAAPELAGLVPTVRSLVGPDWSFHPYGRVARISKLLAASHDFGRSGPGSYLQTVREYGHGAVHGHSHALGIAYGGTQDGTRHAVMACGHLASVDSSDYMHEWKARRDWTTGCGAVYLSDRDYYMRPVPYVGGRFFL